MPDYIEYIQIGENGAKVPIKDIEAREQLAQKAPDGYGLGVYGTSIPVSDDADNCTKNGWYRITENTANGINANGVMRVDAQDGARVTQTVYSGNYTVYGTAIFQRHRYDSVWGEWAFVNPPMVAGVEYRTTERYNGKPVYYNVVNFGAMPNVGSTSINVSGYNAKEVLSVSGVMSSGRPIPYTTTNPTWGSVSVFANAPTETGSIGVAIESTVDTSKYTATIILRYTKTTD